MEPMISPFDAYRYSQPSLPQFTPQISEITPSLLIYYGDFHIFNKRHLSIMDQSIKSQNFIGGLICPSHPSQLYKNWQEMPISASLRRHFIEIGLKGQELWQMDRGSESIMPEVFVQEMERRVREQMGQEIQIVYLIDSENKNNFEQIDVQKVDLSSLSTCLKNSDFDNESVMIEEIRQQIQVSGLFSDDMEAIFKNKIHQLNSIEGLMEGLSFPIDNLFDYVYERMLLDDSKLRQILKQSHIPFQDDEIYTINEIGQDHGFCGKCYRVQLLTKSCVIKLCNDDNLRDPCGEAKLLLTLSAYFKAPTFPHVYLCLQNGDFTMIVMEDIHWGESVHYNDGLSIEKFSSVIDDLAAFHAFQTSNPIILQGWIKQELVNSPSESSFKINNYLDLQFLKSQLPYFENEAKVTLVVDYFLEHHDAYFNALSSKEQNPLFTLCHGDFHMSNVLVEKAHQIKYKTAFIDWQLPFYGNGFVDLSFLLYYGVHIDVFGSPSLFEETFQFYMECTLQTERISVCSANSRLRV